MINNQLRTVTEIVDLAYAGKLRSQADQAANSFREAIYRLTDADWRQLQAHLLTKTPIAENNLDESEALWSVLFPVAQSINGIDHLAIKVRTIGFVASIRWPDYSGAVSYWDAPTASSLAELDLVDQDACNNAAMTLDDLSFFSDVGRSGAGGELFNISRIADQLTTDPFLRLGISLPNVGEILNSMTAVVLLVSFVDEVAEAASEVLNRSGVLLNPRYIHLFCDDSNSIMPWWTEMYPWSRVIDRWKELNPDAWNPRGKITHLAEQLSRSLTWSLYADQNQARLVRQDEDMLSNLLSFMSSPT
jgi:hypothetical protein